MRISDKFWFDPYASNIPLVQKLYIKSSFFCEVAHYSRSFYMLQRLNLIYNYTSLDLFIWDK